MPINAEEARDRIGDLVIDHNPDRRGQIGTLTGVNAPGTVVFVRFPHTRTATGVFPRYLDWTEQGDLI